MFSFFLFILYCRCLYISDDCCALQIKNSDAVLTSSGNRDLFLFCSYIPTWSSKRCLWSCNFKRQIPAFCFGYAIKGHEKCVFADIPRWTRSPLQSVLLLFFWNHVCRLAVSFCSGFMACRKRNNSDALYSTFYYWCLSVTSQECFVQMYVFYFF